MMIQFAMVNEFSNYSNLSFNLSLIECGETAI